MGHRKADASSVGRAVGQYMARNLVRTAFLPALDEEGHIPNLTSKTFIRNPWKEAIDLVIISAQAHFGADLHSLYVRGSVALGAAEVGISDLDMISVTSRPPCSRRFPVARYVCRKATKRCESRFSG